MRATVVSVVFAATLVAGTSTFGATNAVDPGGATLPAGPGRSLVEQNCQICHSIDMVYTQRLSPAMWTAEVTKMISFGSPVQAKDKATLISYLSRYLAPSTPRSGVHPRVTAPPITYVAAPQ